MRHYFLILLLLCSAFLGPQIAAAETLHFINGYAADPASRQATDDYKTLEDANDGWQRYQDYANGYALSVPAGMNLDISLSAVRTVFQTPAHKIEIYRDDLRHTGSTVSEYMEYGNRFLHNTKDHELLQDSYITDDAGRLVHILQWQRRSLKAVPQDRNHYYCAEIATGSSEVYTILIKSTEPIDWGNSVRRSFQRISREGNAGIFRRDNSAAKAFSHQELQAFWQRYFSPSSTWTWGIFEPSAPEVLRPLNAIEESTKHKFPFLLRYQTLEERAPVRGLQQAYEEGRYVELTLSTIRTSDEANALWTGGSSNASFVYEVLDGQHDEYFRLHARQLKYFNHPVLLRLNNEMNGDWCWYSAYHLSKDADLYIALWNHLRRLYAEEGADNVLWVWNPHDVSRPDFGWNHSYVYYPGDDAVDIVGMTGYNNGTYFPSEKWRTFQEIYQPLYQGYSTAFPGKPFLIGEFASNSVGGDKPAWIRDMFSHLKEYPNIKVAIWWSGIDYDQNGQPGRIYILDEDEPTLQAFREGAAKQNPPAPVPSPVQPPAVTQPEKQKNKR